MYDVIIVGAGPTGLSAALVLGRCRRRILICDDGRPRNSVSRGVNGFLTRDGIPPAAFARIARRQLHPYETVDYLARRVDDACRMPGGFCVTLSDGRRLEARKLLIATGLIDVLPQIPGVQQFWGRSIFVCPFCDGWEVRDQPLAVVGAGKSAPDFALEMLGWSRDVVLCTGGPARYPESVLDRLRANGIGLIEKKVLRFEGAGRQLKRIALAGGTSLECSAAFLIVRQQQRSDLPARLGCEFTRSGRVNNRALQRTGIPGLFVAGNASKGLQLVILAAAEGTKAAFAINEELQEEDTVGA